MSHCNLVRGNNRPFPNCCEPHYESDAKCKVFHMKISFVHSLYYENYFHNKNFALSLTFIMRFKATKKWPNVQCTCTIHSVVAVQQYDMLFIHATTEELRKTCYKTVKQK